jgi:hypothetical protein
VRNTRGYAPKLRRPKAKGKKSREIYAAASIESPEALALVRQACEINDDVKHFVQAYELVFG